MATDQETTGTLWPALQRATRRALTCGALQPIENEQLVVEDSGVRFVIRRVLRLTRLQRESRRRAADATGVANPFLPFDPDLFVANVSATHVALLNRFNLIPHHMLIVTRRFVPQEVLLGDEDIAALCACLAQVDALVFYNGGAAAGASQSHKHLQMIPLPLGTGGLPTPIDEVLEAVRDHAGIFAAPGLAFRHSFTWIEPTLFEHPPNAAAHMMSLYPEMLERIGVTAVERDGERYQSAPWNLLITRRWMLAVPRVREDFNGVPINALGFAGLLLVHDDARFATIKRAGPMAALKAVSGG
jgi:ATP adenylyltransferase